ncbi:baseplate J/gp47 family protein [Hungatella sp.]|uniref:baseplate J/gp47 family protein n=1 Tax=Hungatella sp. TaxID=2613924 RepID=UPI002A7ED9B6|nr:baseplate J/gp47 family protein [Hungatella sp.]
MTYEELLQAMLNKVPGSVDKREGSVIYDALAPCAYFLAQQNFQLENYLDLVFPDTAVGEYLDRAVAAFGVTRKPASAAVRKMITTGAVPIGSRWGLNSLVYTVTRELASGTEYEAQCETSGDIGNQYSGSVQPISNITGVTAELTDIISAGADEETDGALRERFLQKVQLPATSGNAYHYKLWALDVPGVGDARVFPLASGPGTVTVLIVDNDKNIDTSLESAVSAYMEMVRPIGANVTIDSPSSMAVNVVADVTLDGSKAKDDVLRAFKAALEIYLKGLVFTDYRVSYARIGSLLLATEGVQDYDNLKLNGAMANVIIADKAIPVMGTVDFSGVRTYGVN